MDTLALFEKIEDYIKNRLSQEDRAAFELEIQANPELASEVTLHRNMMEAAGEREMIAFRKMMEEVAEEMPITELYDLNKTQSNALNTVSKQPKIMRLRWALAVAASLLLAWFIWDQQFISYSSEALFFAYFEAPNSLTLGDSRDDSAGQPFTEAEELLSNADSVYQLKEYDVTLNYLNQALSVTNNATLISEIKRNQGIVLLVLNRGEESERAFQGIEEGFAEDKAWYLAMSLLTQKNKKEEARSALKAFIADADRYSSMRVKRAKEILSKMK